MTRFDQAFRDEFRANWPFLLIGFSTLFIGFSGPAYSLPFIYPEVIKEFGWSREEATLLASAKYVTGAIACLAVGRLLDVTGVWIALITSTIIGGLALVSFLWVDSLTSYYLIGLMLGIAGPGAMVSVFVLVARTFRVSQGTATGIALMGTGLGGVTMPIVATTLIGALGWRMAMATLSLGIWLIALPMLIYGISRLRIPRDGDTSHGADSADKGLSMGAHFRQLAKESSFWFMALAFFLVTIVDQAFTQHQVLMFNDAGISATMGALAISVISLLSMPGRVLAGGVLDKSSNRGMAALYILLSSTAILAFALGSPLLLIAFIVVRALAHASVMIDGPVISRHCFGTRHLGVLLGLFTATANLGSAVGPWLMAFMFDTSGSYKSSLVLFVVLPLLAAVCILKVRPVFWSSQRSAPAADAPSTVSS